MSTFENNEAIYRMSSSVGRGCSGCLAHRVPTEAADRSTASCWTRCCNYWVQKTTLYRLTYSVRRSAGGLIFPLPPASSNQSQVSNDKLRCNYCVVNLISPAVIRALSSRHSIKPADATLHIVLLILHSNSHPIYPAVVGALSSRHAIKPVDATLHIVFIILHSNNHAINPAALTLKPTTGCITDSKE